MSQNTARQSHQEDDRGNVHTNLEPGQMGIFVAIEQATLQELSKNIL